jgi:hypothetical protein
MELDHPNLELPLEIHILTMGLQWKRDGDVFQDHTGLVLTGVLTGVGTLVCLVVSRLSRPHPGLNTTRSDRLRRS